MPAGWAAYALAEALRAALVQARWIIRHGRSSPRTPAREPAEKFFAAGVDPAPARSTQG